MQFCMHDAAACICLACAWHAPPPSPPPPRHAPQTDTPTPTRAAGKSFKRDVLLKSAVLLAVKVRGGCAGVRARRASALEYVMRMVMLGEAAASVVALLRSRAGRDVMCGTPLAVST